MRFIFIFCATLLSCNSKNTQPDKEEWIRGNDKMECLKDSVFTNKDSYSYLINKKAESVDLEITLSKIRFIDTAGYYIDSLDYRAVPTFAYKTLSSLFFTTGFGMNYRVLYRYYIDERKLNKQESYIDDMRKERINRIYPFLSSDSLKALFIDEDWNFEILSIGVLKNNKPEKVDSYMIWDDSIEVSFLDESVEYIPLDLK